jgi:hypothetical protein
MELSAIPISKIVMGQNPDPVVNLVSILCPIIVSPTSKGNLAALSSYTKPELQVYFGPKIICSVEKISILKSASALATFFCWMIFEIMR